MSASEYLKEASELLKQGSYAKLKSVLSDAGVSITQPLFHSTHAATANKIMQTGFHARAGNGGDNAYWDNAVCFSRDMNYVLRGIFGGAEAIFVVDKSELRSRYKVYPLDYFSLRDMNTRHYQLYRQLAKDPAKFEAEERVSLTPSVVERMKADPDLSKDDLLEERETVIPPKYIKAVILLRNPKTPDLSKERKEDAKQQVYQQHKNIMDRAESRGIPVIFYDRKTKDLVHFVERFDRDSSHIDSDKIMFAALRGAIRSKGKFTWDYDYDSGQGIYHISLNFPGFAYPQIVEAYSKVATPGVVFDEDCFTLTELSQLRMRYAGDTLYLTIPFDPTNDIARLGDLGGLNALRLYLSVKKNYAAQLAGRKPVHASFVKEADFVSALNALPQLLGAMGINDPKDVLEMLKILREIGKSIPGVKAYILETVSKMRKLLAAVRKGNLVGWDDLCHATVDLTKDPKSKSKANLFVVALDTVLEAV